MRTVWFGFKLRGIRFRVRIPQFLPRQRGEAFEFEFSSKRNDIVFPEGGEGGVQVREVAPREGAGGGSSSSNSARKNIKFLFPRGRGEFEFSSSSGSGGRAGGEAVRV